MTECAILFCRWNNRWVFIISKSSLTQWGFTDKMPGYEIMINFENWLKETHHGFVECCENIETCALYF